MKKKISEKKDLNSKNPSNQVSATNPVIVDPRRKSPSESPSQFAIRALTQMEEGLKAYEAKHGTLRQTGPKNKQSDKKPCTQDLLHRRFQG